MNEKKRKVKKLLDELSEHVPTMIFAGRTTDHKIAIYISSPEDDTVAQVNDLRYAIISSMLKDPLFFSLLHTSVSFYLTKNFNKLVEVKRSVKTYLDKRNNKSPKSNH